MPAIKKKTLAWPVLNAVSDYPLQAGREKAGWEENEGTKKHTWVFIERIKSLLWNKNKHLPPRLLPGLFGDCWLSYFEKKKKTSSSAWWPSKKTIFFSSFAQVILLQPFDYCREPLLFKMDRVVGVQGHLGKYSLCCIYVVGFVVLDKWRNSVLWQFACELALIRCIFHTQQPYHTKQWCFPAQ